MKITWVTFGARLARDPRRAAVLRLLEQGQDHRGGVHRRGLAAVGVRRRPRSSAPAITAFYMSRLFFMTFHGQRRWTDRTRTRTSRRR